MTSEYSILLNLLLNNTHADKVTILLIILLHGQVERLRRRIEKMRREVNDCRERLSKIESKEKQKANDPSPV